MTFREDDNIYIYVYVKLNAGCSALYRSLYACTAQGLVSRCGSVGEILYTDLYGTLSHRPLDVA